MRDQNVPHWIVITGISNFNFSKQKKWSMDVTNDNGEIYSIGSNDYFSDENWVRIYNPFDNETEYYPWSIFAKTWIKTRRSCGFTTIIFILLGLLDLRSDVYRIFQAGRLKVYWDIDHFIGISMLTRSTLEATCKLLYSIACSQSSASPIVLTTFEFSSFIARKKPLARRFFQLPPPTNTLFSSLLWLKFVHAILTRFISPGSIGTPWRLQRA